MLRTLLVAYLTLVAVLFGGFTVGVILHSAF